LRWPSIPTITFSGLTAQLQRAPMHATAGFVEVVHSWDGGGSWGWQEKLDAAYGHGR
jgi:hypothetical protein